MEKAIQMWIQSILITPYWSAAIQLTNPSSTSSSSVIKHLLVALQLACRWNSKEAVCPGVVDQRAWQQETREEPAERVAVLLEEHQHPVHRLDTKGVVTWRRGGVTKDTHQSLLSQEGPEEESIWQQVTASWLVWESPSKGSAGGASPIYFIRTSTVGESGL